MVRLFIAHRMSAEFFAFIGRSEELVDIAKILAEKENGKLDTDSKEELIRSNYLIVMTASHMYYHEGAYEKAQEYFRILAEDDPKDYYAAYYCGLCRVAMGRLSEAYVMFRKAVATINPGVAEKRLDEMIKLCQQKIK